MMNETRSKYPDTAQQTAWLRLSRDRDTQAFNHIVELYQQPVFNLCYHMLHDRAEAEDAAQEVFVRAYLKLDRYDETRQFSTWLFAVASHYCLDRLKRRRLFMVPWEQVPPEIHLSGETLLEPEQALLKAETDQEIRQLLQQLHPDHRAMVIMKYWQDMSCEEIAEARRTTASAVKSKLFRARKLLGEVLRQTEAQSETPAPLQLVPVLS
jgi:RNA polymerase sigma-70 factor (ECF subfamily)